MKQPKKTKARQPVFVEEMMWIACTGRLWRDLPERYPNRRSVYTR